MYDDSLLMCFLNYIEFLENFQKPPSGPSKLLGDPYLFCAFISSYEELPSGELCAARQCKLRNPIFRFSYERRDLGVFLIGKEGS